MKNPLKHWSRQRARFRAMQEQLDHIEMLVESMAESKSRSVAIGSNSNEPVIFDRLGLSLLLDRSSLVDEAVIRLGRWEKTQIDFLFSTALRTVEIRNAVFVDIGAYWGLYSLIASRKGFGRVLAFEADRYNFSQLQAQLFLNKLSSNIEAHNFPISDSNRSVTLFESLNHAEGNRGGVGVTDDSAKGGRKAEARSLDSVLNLSSVELVMKIDVEGHEASVLKGMKDLISRNKVLIQVEIFEEQEATVFPICQSLGLKKINQIAVDHYFTNSK